MLKKTIVAVSIFIGIFIWVSLPLGLNASKIIPQEKVIQFVNETISKTADQLNGPASTGGESSGWDMTRVFIRVQAIMGIGLEMFTSFQIVPEVEFVLQKVNR